MNRDQSHFTAANAPLKANAYAIHRAVRAIRKARGKLNPDDCVMSREEHEAVMADFLTDLSAAMAEYAID